MRKLSLRLLASLLALFVAMPPHLSAQQGQGPVFKPEELEQILAPIALYPDELVSQILMAATYPLEVVQADRFAQQNKNLKGDDLTQSLESQSWDPSVKSLVNFPQVLTMMSEKLDWTQKLGDAFLAQQEDVMDTIQKLRFRAQESGNLKTTKEQKVIVQEKVIVIEPATPQVVYVPTYNPTVVYGAWPYPAYPPYYYYPPGYVATTSFFSFAAGIAVGSAWGYAWGRPDWYGKKVKVDNSINININNKIDRRKYAKNYPSGGRGDWKHNPEHRRGVNYRDQRTAQQYNRGVNTRDVRAREAYRGRAEQGRRDLARGGADQLRGGQRQDRGAQPAARDRAGTADRGQQARDRVGGADRGGQPSARDRAGRVDRGGASQPGGRGGADRSGMQNRGGAFQGVDRGGSSARSFSERGSSSRRGGAARGSGGGGGGARGGGSMGGGGRRR